MMSEDPSSFGMTFPPPDSPHALTSINEKVNITTSRAQNVVGQAFAKMPLFGILDFMYLNLTAVLQLPFPI